MTQYWLTRDNQRRGPYEESDILEGVELGTVRPHDLLWVEGMNHGVPIAEVIANLGSAPASRPPPLPLELAPLAPAARSPYRTPLARVDDLAELALGNVLYAGFWARFGAMVLDNLIIGVIGIAIGVVIGAAGRFLEMRISPNDLWASLLGVAVSWLYFAAMESGPRCAGYGKRAFKLQVLAVDSMTRIGFGRATVRWLGRILSSIVLMIGYLMQPFTPRKRALHDYLSGTVVVALAPTPRVLLAVMIFLTLAFALGIALLLVPEATLPGAIPRRI